MNDVPLELLLPQDETGRFSGLLTRNVICADTYIRCPAEVPSYNQYCYVILTRQVTYTSVKSICSERFHGVPVWYESRDEVDWTRTLFQAHGVDCFHLGEHH